MDRRQVVRVTNEAYYDKTNSRLETDLSLPPKSLPNPSQVYWDDWTLLGVQLLTLIALVVYVWKTSQIAKATIAMAVEARDTREAAMAPRVVIYFDPNEHHWGHFVLENVGAGTAVDTRFKFKPPLRSAEEFDAVRFFDSPKVLPPGYRLVHLFDSWPAYFAANLPMRYEVTVTYRGVESGKTYSYTHELDLESVKHRQGLIRHNLHDLVDRLEKMERNFGAEFKKIDRRMDSDAARRTLIPQVQSLQNARASFDASFDTFVGVWESEGAYLDWDGSVDAMRQAAISLNASLRAAGADGATLKSSESVVVALYHGTHIGDQEWVPRLSTAVETLRRDLTRS